MWVMSHFRLSHPVTVELQVARQFVTTSFCTSLVYGMPYERQKVMLA